jgi:endonuclease/exonuclease/phosphatase family metal-dependent hydrolase
MKIVTLNLRHDADRWEERFPLVVEELRKEAPDVVAFQEVALGINQAQLIAEKLNEHVAREPYSVFVEAKGGQEQNEGIAVLTRLPVIDHHRLDLPEGNRVAQRVRVMDKKQPVDIVNTHLHHLPPDDESIRLPQITTLLDWMFGSMEKQPGRILVGDLNAVSESETIAQVRRRMASAYSALHPSEPSYTFPTPLVAGEGKWYTPRTLDYIFFEPALFQVQDARLIFKQPHPHDSTLLPSDHYGLATVLSRREQETSPISPHSRMDLS